MKEPSTNTEKNPKFKVGEIVYLADSSNTEEYIVTGVYLNVNSYIKYGNVSFEYVLIPKNDYETPAIQKLRELGTLPPSYDRPIEIRRKEDELINDIGECLRGRIRKYENEREAIAQKILELQKKLVEKEGQVW